MVETETLRSLQRVGKEEHVEFERAATERRCIVIFNNRGETANNFRDYQKRVKK